MSGPEELRALVEWEMFCDAAYFDMWCVRRVGDTAFGSGFHLPSMGEAKALLDALTRAEPSLASPAGMEGWTRAVRDVFEIELKINGAEPMEAMERALAAASLECASTEGRDE